MHELQRVGQAEDSPLAGVPDDPLADYLDVHEAAVRLGIRSRSVNRLIKKRQLPAEEFFGKNFIARSVFESFAEDYGNGNRNAGSARGAADAQPRS